MKHHSNRRLQKFFKLLFKLTLVGGLLYFLSQKGFLSLQDTRRAFSRWDLIVPAVLIQFLNLFLGALRWQWLLRAQGIEITLKRNFELSFIGNFFNVALPGAVSGDFVKAFYIGKQLSGHRGPAFGAILFDRVAGLSALVLLSAFAVVLGHESLASSVVVGTRPFLIVAALCVLFFYGYLFLVQEKQDPVLSLLKRLQDRIPKLATIVRIYLGLRHYHSHRMTVMKVLGLSLVIHLLIGLVCLQFALALGDSGVSLHALYVVVPIGLLITAVPVAPAGVGTGHAAFSYLFHLLGSARGADVFTLLALSSLFFGAMGGVVYLRFKGHESEPLLA